MIDKDKLFSIFEKGDEEIYQEHGVSEVLSNPFVLLNMVVRGIENYQLMDLLYSRNYPKEYIKVKDKIKYKYYLKLFSYLNRITIPENTEDFNIGESYDIETTFLSLESMKDYFESLEEYEKCGKIKKYIDLLLDKV